MTVLDRFVPLGVARVWHDFARSASVSGLPMLIAGAGAMTTHSGRQPISGGYRKSCYAYGVLSVTERVWRHLIVSASTGRREWSTLTELAAEVDSAVSSVHDALYRPVEIGAVGTWPAGGVMVLDPERLTVLWAGRRRLVRDVKRRFRAAAQAPEVEQALAAEPVVLGGFGAVVAALGANTIADYETVLVYGEPAELEEALDGPTEVIVLDPDPLLARYGRTTRWRRRGWTCSACLVGRPLGSCTRRCRR